MRPRRLTAALALVAPVALLLGTAVPAMAHHSAAEFDNGREVSLAGTVKAFEWTNPHGWLRLLVSGADGTVTQWDLEMQGVLQLRMRGWTHSTVKVGDHVEVVVHPARSGSPRGSLQRLTTPAGETLRQWGPNPEPPAS